MNYLDIVGFIILGVAAVQGYRSGFIIQLSTLVGLIGGVFAAYYFSDYAYSVLQEFFDLSPQILSILSFTLTFVLVLILVSLLGKLLNKLIDIMSLGVLNKLAGSAFSLIKAGFILSILIFILNSFVPNSKFFSEKATKDSYLYEPIASIAPLLIPYLDGNMLKEIQKKAEDFGSKPKKEEVI